MNLRISGVLAIAAFAFSGVLGSEQSLAQNAYITNAFSNNVSVIDTATNMVIATIPIATIPIATIPIATIPIGNTSPEGVAITPGGSRVYITNLVSNTVSGIETATNMVTATIGVGNNPFGVAVTPDGSKVYVANIHGGVSVIDTAKIW